HLTGSTHELTTTLRALAIEFRSDTGGPGVPPPATLPEITRVVDADNEVHLGDLVAALCPDPGTAEQALAGLLATAAVSADQAHGTQGSDQLPGNDE
ncbi:MAG: hypothetical protein ACRDSZ_04360, partial [Pseudonocardiaceae bacterium]